MKVRLSREKMIDYLVITIGIAAFLFFLSSPVVFLNPVNNPQESLQYSALSFIGFAATDLAQDMIGHRAMVQDDNAYPNLGSAHKELGLDFPLDAVSTHPPSTFLFVAPIAFLPWRAASSLWAGLMLLGIICTFRLMGSDWLRAIGYGFLSIFWLPLMMSFGQFTILWLLLATLAFKVRNSHPFASGVFIGIASLIKLFPVVLIVPLLIQKKWSAVLGLFLTGMMG